MLQSMSKGEMISEIDHVQSQLDVQSWRDATNREEIDPDSDLTDLAVVLSRVFGWLADGKTLDRIGLRTAVLINLTRPDLLPATSLAEMSGTSRQNVSKLTVSFRATFGLRESTKQIAKKGL
jgi:hypothetical protein